MRCQHSQHSQQLLPVQMQCQGKCRTSSVKRVYSATHVAIGGGGGLSWKSLMPIAFTMTCNHALTDEGTVAVSS